MGLMDEIRQNWQLALDILKPSAKDLEHGLELHRNSLVFDAYGFVPAGGGECLRVDEFIRANAARDELRYIIEEFGKNSSFRDPENRKKLREVWDFAGVDCVFQNCGEESSSIETLIKRLSSYIAVTDRLEGFYERAAFPEHIEQIRSRGHKCIYMTTNGVPISSQLDSAEAALMHIQVFANFGVRMMHLTYNRRNLLGDGCAEAANSGLSELGRMAVKEMNRVGIIPDIAHSGQRTSIEAALCSEKPVVASHAVAGRLSTHCRARQDEVIEAVKRTNGYVGICAIPHFCQGSRLIDSFIDHIDYVARTFGADHVAIGTDRSIQLAPTVYSETMPKNRPIFEKYWGPQRDNSTMAEYNTMAWTNWPLFTVALVQRGYSDSDIRKIIGGNVLRVCKETFAGLL